MAILGASFQIGRSALAAYQSAISITGQNIANLGNPDYARQSGRLEALLGGPVLGGVKPGAGVAVTSLRRHIDEALESRLRNSIGAQSSAATLYASLSQTEALYGELSDADLSTLLANFFGSFNDVQTRPEDATARNLVLASGGDVIRTLNRLRDGLVQQSRDLNDDVAADVNNANALAREIAGLNAQIVNQESDKVTIASALRDRRDQMLRELAQLVNVQTREAENGSINVYVGSEPLVQFDRAREMVLERTIENGLEVAQVRYADNGGTVTVRGGKLEGVLLARDEHLRDQLDRLDQLARGLIYEVNRIHSTGVGLVGYASQVGAYGVIDPNLPLNHPDAGVSFPVRNGAMVVNVRDRSSGQVITRQIEVDLDGLHNNDTSLSDIAGLLDAVPGLNASVTTDNRLSITAQSGQEFWFSDDTSGALAALGVGAFFEGTNASNIAIRAEIQSDPRLLAASLSGNTLDGDNAGRMAALADSMKASALLSGRSIQDFHASMVNDLAVNAAAAATDAEASEAIYQGLYAQREAVSGVNLDEEAINLARFEQAYQGAARYLSVLDEMGAELLALL